MAKKFEGQVAVVTGAGRGIGAATARALAAQGAKVVLMARTQSELDREVAHIVQAGGQALAIAGDVSSEDFVRSAFLRAQTHFGSVSILVNAAAMIRVKPLIETQASEWDQTQGVNVRGVFLCAREALLQMSKNGGGAIVNISSLGGIQGTEKFAGFGAYSTSKFAVVGLTECLAVEGKPLGVRANVVAPGAVETQMLKEAAPFLKTTTQPQDIAALILPLCEREGVTGQVLELHTNG